ncbi:cell wall-binding repeat-containing protein [Methanocella sp. MCL-LM]|uniref:cell wall-binding repeat-containing protein n=1 Tax=Methanocella sp. MCL-LM TaxID=3412035 RepID=UPI003C74AA5A
MAEHYWKIGFGLALVALFLTIVFSGFGARPCEATAGHTALNSDNIAHLTGANPWDTSVNISRYIYTSNKPGVVMIVNAEESNYPVALAAAALQHHPRNGPILFTAYEGIADSTYDEIIRLDSLAGKAPVKILAVGELSDNCLNRLATTGLDIQQIKGRDAYETAYLIDEMLGFPQTIMIASATDGGTASCAAAWAAHAGTPILLVDSNRIPEPTYRAINATYQPEIYLIGNESAIPKTVEEQLRSLDVKSVDRVPGETPGEVSVNLAVYRKGLFGWGKMSDSANSFAIVRTGDWLGAINAGLLGHLNRHMPILFTGDTTLAPAVADYLDSINQPDTPVPDYAIIIGEPLGGNVESALSAIMRGAKTVVIEHGPQHSG